MTGAELKAIRLSLKMSQKDFGHRVGVNNHSIYGYETEKRPIPVAIATLVKIMATLKTSNSPEYKLRHISTLIHLDKD